MVVQFPQGDQLELRANDQVVPSNLVGRTETNAQTQTMTQTFYGVGLKEGKNTLTAQTLRNGTVAASVTVEVQVRGAVNRLEVSSLETRIPADGRSKATIVGKLLDEQGNVSNRDGMVTLFTNAGEFVGEDADPDLAGFQVEAKQGGFAARLQAGLDAQQVTIRAVSNSLEAFTNLEFETDLRPAIATGVVDLRLGGRGTNFYDSFRDFLPVDGNNSLQFDGKAAAFATGRVGDWLFTGAVNTSQALNQTCDGNRLFRVVMPCDNNYPTYGDTSQSFVVTPSTDSVFLRFERSSPIPGADTDYFMWGDYNTDEFATQSQEFTSFTRQLHGFKANYNLGNLQITGLYGNNINGFQRDTIAPDGTSGYYFLSRRLVKGGSENVYLETKELNQPGNFLSSKQLQRGKDYEIDYDRGTLLFREPILRTDVGPQGQTILRQIVVTYEYETPSQENQIYAGRLRYHFNRSQGQESWLGGTYLQQNQGVRDYQLYGADAFVSLGNNSSLIAEYAHSTNESDLLGQVSGSAYRFELNGELSEGAVNGRLYYRKADTGFANNATISFISGQTRYGAQIGAQVSPSTRLNLQYDYEANQGVAPRVVNTIADLLQARVESLPGQRVDNSLSTVSVGLQQQLGRADLSVDWFHRSFEDRLVADQGTEVFDQLRTRLTIPLADNLTFLAQNETTFANKPSQSFPDRTVLGLNWGLLPGMSLQLSQQWFGDGVFAGQSMTILDLAGDYQLGPDTKLSGRVGVANGERGITTQGAIGLRQGIKLTKGLLLDLSYEHVFGNFFTNPGTGQQFSQPFAAGQSSASLGIQGGDSYSAGLSYTNFDNFQANVRFQHNTSSAGGNTVITAGATGKLSPAFTALFNYQQASSANQGLQQLGTTASLKLGLTYRDPNDDRLNALLRYEYRKNPALLPESILFSTGSGYDEQLLGLEAIYAPNWQWEFYGKFALRSGNAYLADDLIASSTATLAQLRATYRLAKRWDLAGEARWINQANQNYSETGFVVEAGYYFTPNLRLSAGYTFGRVSDRDFGEARSANSPFIGLTFKLNELFSGFGLQKVPEPAQTESKAPTPIASDAQNQTASDAQIQTSSEVQAQTESDAQTGD